jgi:hypothetical protein
MNARDPLCRNVQRSELVLRKERHHLADGALEIRLQLVKLGPRNIGRSVPLTGAGLIVEIAGLRTPSGSRVEYIKRVLRTSFLDDGATWREAGVWMRVRWDSSSRADQHRARAQMSVFDRGMVVPIYGFRGNHA